MVVNQTLEIVKFPDFALPYQQIEILRDQVATIYRDAFRAPPYNKGEGDLVDFARSFPQHMRREGFRMVAVEDKAGRIVGFAYGYTSAPGQRWHENVVKAVQPQIALEWLANSFQLVEIAVTPGFQGQGIGGLLHDHLLTGLPHRKAVLSTLQAETNAYRMYRGRGWVVLLEDWFFPGMVRAYRVLGLALGKKGEDAAQKLAREQS